MSVKQPSAKTHVWYYMKTTVFNESQEGPVDEKTLLSLAAAGEIRPKTKISSPTRTNGQWIYAEAVPKLMSVINEGLAERKRGKAERKQNKQVQKVEKRQQKVLAKKKVLAELDGVAINAPPNATLLPRTGPQTGPNAHLHIDNRIATQVVAATQVVVEQPQTNAVGMAGFVMSLVSLLTLGILSPLAAIFSLIGVFSKPRGFAVAGLIISGVSCILLLLFWWVFLFAPAVDQVVAASNRVTAFNKVDEFVIKNERLPTADEYSKLFSSRESSIADFVRYEVISESVAQFTRPGPDGEFGTPDDWETEQVYESLIPADENESTDQEIPDEESTEQFDSELQLVPRPSTRVPVKKSWYDVGEQFENDAIRFAVIGAKITKPKIKAIMGETTSEDDLLVVRMEVTNKDDRKQLTFYENQFMTTVSAQDDVENRIRKIHFGIGSEIVDALRSGNAINPEQTVQHVFVFDKPLPKTEYIMLDFDLKMYGLDGDVKVKVKADTWK